MDAIEEIKRLYYAATKATIQKDLARAIDLLKTMPDEDARERVAVYMDGLAQMRSEWAAATRRPYPPGSARPSSAPPNGRPPARSGRSPASSRRRG